MTPWKPRTHPRGLAKADHLHVAPGVSTCLEDGSQTSAAWSGRLTEQLVPDVYAHQLLPSVQRLPHASPHDACQEDRCLRNKVPLPNMPGPAAPPPPGQAMLPHRVFCTVVTERNKVPSARSNCRRSTQHCLMGVRGWRAE